MDTDGRICEADVTGEIVVRGYNVMTGYFNNPEATADTIDTDGWLHTGDIGTLDVDGNIRITDRLKDMFISGGFNCYPAEIENQLCSTGCGAGCRHWHADERMGEVCAAFVVPTPNSGINDASLIAWSREHMANYKVPRRVIFTDNLPLNASGKVLKTTLRTML